MDVIPCLPGSSDAMIGASHMDSDLVKSRRRSSATAPDLCSYARADIACARENGGPIGGLPKPDMLICCNNICGTVLKWYEVHARYFNVPTLHLRYTFCHTEFPDMARTYVRERIDEYIAFLEQACGKPFDMEKSKEVGRLSIEGQRLWQEVLDTAAHQPAPMTAFDAFSSWPYRHVTGSKNCRGFLQGTPC